LVDRVTFARPLPSLEVFDGVAVRVPGVDQFVVWLAEQYEVGEGSARFVGHGFDVPVSGASVSDVGNLIVDVRLVVEEAQDADLAAGKVATGPRQHR